MEDNFTTTITSNSLYLGDNLSVLDNIPDKSIDLIYLDPPFNSKKDYNIIFSSESGIPLDQKTVFEDTWKYTADINEMVNDFMENIGRGYYSSGLEQLMKVWIDVLKENDSQMLAYLVMMVQRLDKLYRKLKSTGILYLHCDQTASHYLKIALDSIFSRQNFRNEIIWHYTNRLQQSKSDFSQLHDVILCYGKTQKSYFTPQYDPDWKPSKTQERRLKAGYEVRKGELIIYDQEKFDKTGIDKSKYKKVHEDAKANQPPIGNVWDIPILNPMANERIGYPTQKPLKLLKRIVQSSCPEGGVVLDPFCGCGTAMEAAQLLNCKWIGIDVCKYAVDKIMERLEKIGLQRQVHYEVYNYPFVFDHIERLLEQKHGRYIFQDWAIEKVRGMASRKKIGDHGVDGTLYFHTPMNKKKYGRMVLSVKSDKKLQTQYIRDLIGTMNNQGAEMAGLISLVEPTEGMRLEASNAGRITIDSGVLGEFSYPKVQILTVKDIFAGKTFNTPHTRTLK